MSAPEVRADGRTLLLTSDRLGTGDDLLGRKLMRSLLCALCDAARKPRRVLLLNAGVRLAVEDDETVDRLRMLEAAGVEILSCGTCVGHFGYEGRLRVGAVTKMAVAADLLVGDEGVVVL